MAVSAAALNHFHAGISLNKTRNMINFLATATVVQPTPTSNNSPITQKIANNVSVVPTVLTYPPHNFALKHCLTSLSAHGKLANAFVNFLEDQKFVI
jgi:hypothetical protein